MAEDNNLRNIISEMISAELQQFKKEIEQSFKEKLPEQSAAEQNFNLLFDNFTGGKKFDARKAANKVAGNFRPIFDDFFKSSASQIGDQLSGLLGLGQRNL